jgi:hypothetical protein
MRLCPDVIAIQQPIQLLRGEAYHFLLQHPRPVILLCTLNALAPKREVVFIKPLFRMSLIDRENTVWNALSWGVPA